MSAPQTIQERIALWQAACIVAENVPRCCLTCEWFNDQGVCELFNEKPPKEFTETLDACGKWARKAPF